MEDGSILAWGDNRWGQTTVPKTDKKFIAIRAGCYFSLGLLEDGSILAWGANSFDQTMVPKQIKNLSP